MNFNWSMRSLTAHQIQKRINILLLMLEREQMDIDEKKKMQSMANKKPPSTITSTMSAQQSVSVTVEVHKTKIPDQITSNKRKIDEIEVNSSAAKKQKVD